MILAIATLVPLIGCSSQPDTDIAPEVNLAPQSVDDRFVMLAEAFPGFAGRYYDDGGRLVLNVAEPPGSSQERTNSYAKRFTAW